MEVLRKSAGKAFVIFKNILYDSMRQFCYVITMSVRSAVALTKMLYGEPLHLVALQMVKELMI